MSKTTKIQWADSSWSPWRGCMKVSDGCKFCYAEALAKRNPKVFGEWGKGAPRVFNANWEQVRQWDRNAEKYPGACLQCGKRFAEPDSLGMPWECPDCKTEIEASRPKIFPSLCDWLDDEVPVEWLSAFLRLIYDTPNIDWLLLTKRPGNWRKRMRDTVMHGDMNGNETAAIVAHNWTSGKPPQNVWLGVSIESPDLRWRAVDLVQTPAAIRFVSAEPLLGRIDINYDQDLLKKIHWVIFGGESHRSRKKARPCDINWIRFGVQQCRNAGTAAFVKQLGSNPYESPRHDNATGSFFQTKDPKGGDWNEWPEDLKVRQFPKPINQ